MDDGAANAIITEPNTTFYRVRLTWLPRVGDLIDLYSFVEASDNRPPDKNYEVVQVVHKLHDVTDAGIKRLTGAHSVVIHVRKAGGPIDGAFDGQEYAASFGSTGVPGSTGSTQV